MLRQSIKPVSNVFLDRLQDVLQCRFMSAIYMISAVVCLFGGYTFLAFSLLLCCLYSNPILIWKAQKQYRSVLNHFGLNAVMLTGVLLGLLGGVIVGLAFTEPSHAQFFNNAQNFVTKVFKSPGTDAATATSVVDLVMNTLRLLFVMYMLFGIVQVFQAVRQGEEWKDLARTPFFVVLAGTLGDVLVGAIVGTSATTATTGTPTIPGLPR
jgi:hypothetical protein